MKKLLLSALFFLAIFALLPAPSALAIDLPLFQKEGVNLHVSIEPGIITEDTEKVTVTIEAEREFFTLNKYYYVLHQEGKRFDSASASDEAPVNSKTFVATWELIGGFRTRGVWNFTLTAEGALPNVTPANTILSFQYEILPKTGIHPEIAVESPVRVGTPIKFTLRNLTPDQTYSVWVDEDERPRATPKAESATYIGSMNPLEKLPEPPTKKICMNIGDHRVLITGPGDDLCKYFVYVSFQLSSPTSVQEISSRSTRGSADNISGPVYGPQGELKDIYCDPKTGTTYDSKSTVGQEAGGISTAIGCIPVKDTNELVAWVLSWAIGIAGGVAFLLMLFAGFKIMTASGNPERLQSGRELLTAAISGLILIIFSVFLLKLIGVEILQLPGFGTK